MANASALDDVAVPEGLAGMRRHALDGAMLLFDRETGLNARCEGPETAHLRRAAPRVVQFGLTNHCNLRCGFCSRDLDAASTWTADDAFVVLRDLAAAGVLEVAFGGGEPLVFAGFDALLSRLYDDTPLAVNLTTNGVLLDRERLRRWHDDRGRPRYGQIRISLYDDNDWRAKVRMLAEARARFGVNLLVDPRVAERLEDIVLELAALGCRDVVLLAYNGDDRSMHLDLASAARLADRVRVLARALVRSVVLKLDVCWGSRMATVPQLFTGGDCGAGRELVVVTSDRRVMPCSFHQLGFPFTTAADILAIWSREQQRLSTAAITPGCARTPGFGLDGQLVQLATPRRPA